MKSKGAEGEDGSDDEQHGNEGAEGADEAVFNKDGGKDGAAGMTDGFQDADFAAAFKHGKGNGVSNDDKARNHSEGGDGSEHDDEVVENLIDEGVDIDDTEDDGVGNGFVEVLFESWQLVGIDFEREDFQGKGTAQLFGES